MTGREFVELVRDMRAKQVEYFKTRSSDVLRESKQLERRVDAAIRDWREGQPALPGCESP